MNFFSSAHDLHLGVKKKRRSERIREDFLARFFTHNFKARDILRLMSGQRPDAVSHDCDLAVDLHFVRQAIQEGAFRTCCFKMDKYF